MKNAVKKDPFLKYGPGLQNYFVLQQVLMKVFVFLSLCAAVQMCLYRSLGGIDYLDEDVIPVSAYAWYSMGSMGFSKSICGRAPLK